MANIFNEYPYRNYNDFNLDYILRKLLEMDSRLTDYVKRSTISFHDPITWDITEQYTVNTMVVDTDGTAYLSVRAVPAGVDISNTDYWQPIFNYDDNINYLRANIATNTKNTGIITEPLTKDSIVWYNGNLYVLTVSLNAGSQLIPGTNCEKITIELWVKSLFNSVSSLIDAESEARISADNALGNRIDAEAQSRISADNALGNRIDVVSTSVETERNERTTSDNDINRKIETVNGRVDEVNSRVDNIIAQTDRYYLIVSDSYGDEGNNGGQTYTSKKWSLTCREILKIKPDHWFNFAVSGSGFISPGGSFMDQVNNENALSLKDKITDILVVGGLNDAQPELSQTETQTRLVNSINSFIQYVKTNYSKATIHFGYAGNAIDNSPAIEGRTIDMRNRAKYLWNQTAKNNGCSVIPDVDLSWTTNANYFYSDLVHPSFSSDISADTTDMGCGLLAKAISQYLIGGKVEPSYPMFKFTDVLSLEGGVTKIDEIIAYIDNNNLHLHANNSSNGNIISVVGSFSFGIAPTKIAHQDFYYFNKPIKVSGAGYAVASGGSSIYDCGVAIRFDGYDIYIEALKYSGGWVTNTCDSAALYVSDIVIPMEYIN